MTQSNQPSFVHLHVHTEYSLVDGMLGVKPLVQQVAQRGMPAVAVTDRNNLFALVKFYKAARAAGVKPIIGCEMLVEAASLSGEPAPLVFLVQGLAGYRNLTQLITRGYLENQKQGQAVLKPEWVVESNTGLIALCGGRRGEIGQLLLAHRTAEAEQQLVRWRAAFGDRFYLEVSRTGRPGESAHVRAAVELAVRTNAPVVATNDVVFLDPDDFDAHEARVCIHEGRTLADPRRPRRYSPQQYLRSAAEMAELFADLPEALENSVEIAKRCSLELELGKSVLPDYPTPPGTTEEAHFRQVASDGLERRLTARPVSPEGVARQAYLDRLEAELGIIVQMGFSGYFLIVMDFIDWARNNGVPVGPGRGSGAGSIVAWALGITDLDPLAYDLLFERFLNPERVSMPDFDIDFCMEGRDRVIQYVADRYGRGAVSQIITFGTMAAKAVVRDVARVLGRPYGLGDRISKLIPFEVGMTLEKALEQEPALRELMEDNDEVAEIMEMSFKLEGVARNVGKHAGGVVIAPGQLTDFAPLWVDDSGTNPVTQFDKDDVEAVGLVKFDFLGLRTLTIIAWALEGINQERRERGEEEIDIAQIPLDDAEVYRLLQTGETTAVFQLESRGMQELIRRLGPSRFEDIVALVALYRPGPLQSGMVDDFINRKHGRARVQYLHPKLETILEPTYGVILYQEQVMQIAQVLAGYTLGGADLLRRAMGKKKPEEMAKQRQIFDQGAAEQGVDPKVATEIFDLMEKFAGYGFNKSHSAAYALVSYQTGWLKAHYPAPFMAAVLSADMQSTDKVVHLIEACRKMGLEVLPPSVNQGEFRFAADGTQRIIYGLGAIKGLGEGPVAAIVQARQHGPFEDLFDLCRRLDLQRVNKRALEALVKAGAFDDFDRNRAGLYAAIPDAVRAAEQDAANAASGTVDLFGGPGGPSPAAVVSRRSVSPWRQRELLQAEKETLGLYLSGHPIDEYEAELRGFGVRPLDKLQPDKEPQLFAGLLVAQRIMKSKRGETMAFLTLDDRTARIEVSLFGELYAQYRDHLVKDEVLVVEGTISHDEYSGSLRARARGLMGLDAARARFAQALELEVTADQFREPGWVAELEALMAPHRAAGCPVVVLYRRADAKGRVDLGASWQVRPGDRLLNQLRERFGAERVRMRYH